METPAPTTAPATPIMQQYLRVRAEHPGALLFFRMGDFFELFYDDARTAARVLGIALTSREKGANAVPMAGVPVRTASTYLQRLVRAGFPVAICDQVEEPGPGRDLLRREVVRIVTAGTITEEEILERGAPNYLASGVREGARTGLAWVDLSTGRFLVEDLESGALPDEIARIAPAELLLPEAARGEGGASLVREGRPVLGYRPDWHFERGAGLRALREQFRVSTLAGFGVEESSPAIGAAGALLQYLRETQKTALPHLAAIERFDRGHAVLLDAPTRATLELVENRRGERQGTLLWALDRTRTAMGGRTLREWVLAPLRDPAAILHRQRGVAALVEDADLRSDLSDRLGGIADLERLASRVACGRAHPRDLAALRASLGALPALRGALEGSPDNREPPLPPVLSEAAAAIDPCAEVRGLLERAIVEAPPLATTEGGLIRDGFDAELDELRGLKREGTGWLARLEAKEVERSGIANLRVGFHRVFGYFLEVPRSQAERVPSDYHRKQTLKNAERFVTPELKDFETKVLRSDERAKTREREIFEEVRGAVAREVPRLLATGRALGILDALLSLSQVASENRYVAPAVDEGEEIRIAEGRHPVLERTLGDCPFVPNDALLDLASSRLLLLTGPNMAGKSVFLRQVALIALLAQIGSFVPASSARVGVVDRIFARIGSADEIAVGRSTFMVEMVETANILHGATRRSLVLLDEVGRGTSTFDGLALAWAIAERLLTTTACRTLFATHYHPLTDLAARFPGARNLHLDVREWGEEVVFLYKVVEGATDRSYGLHCARLAGVPAEVVERAREVLRDLESDEEELSARLLARSQGRRRETPGQLDLFAARRDAILADLAALDPEKLTPIDALLRLKALRERIG
ncbi:MAG: DNA mismatch repair protein MutS [Planctomycetes bacterium]|nr:DNA mismatch repair protein MutS [Planctomycetota bacterium]